VFPCGYAEFVTPRLRDVIYPQYVRHLMLNKHMRFDQHLRFRYVAFNTIMRAQIKTRGGFVVNTLHPEHKAFTVEQLRDAFNDDTDKSKQIINTIT
jgi:hypothetical protein